VRLRRRTSKARQLDDDAVLQLALVLLEIFFDFMP
jgi:hypothetical protein